MRASNPSALNHPTRLPAADRAQFRNITVVMGCGIFVSGFAQVAVIGSLPFRLLLKDHLGYGATMVSVFTQVAAIPWNLKFLAGVVTDGVPIFGTRRRHYLMLTSAAAALLWLAVGLVPPRYVPLLLMVTIMNVALVFVSTVSGGLLVEAGQRFGATGRISSWRVVADNVAMLGLPLGGLLAAMSLETTAAMAAAPLLGMFLVAMLLLREPNTCKRDPQFWAGIRAQFSIVFRSRILWATAGLLFLIQFSPGFQDPLLFYQRDDLHFSSEFISLLLLVDVVAGASGALAYGYFCRRRSLRFLLYASIVVTALVTLLFMAYNGRKSAILIEAVYFFVYWLAQLPLFDLAARATPRGNEAMGYAVILSIWNWGLFASNLIGSALYEHAHIPFKHLVWINAATTALVLIAVPFLPKRLVDVREGDPTPG